SASPSKSQSRPAPRRGAATAPESMLASMTDPGTHPAQCNICAGMAIMLACRLAMIQHDPPITRKTMNTPKASARMLFVLSGPLPRCRKKTRCTPICAKASTTSPTGMPGAHNRSDWNARRPQQVRLRHDKGTDRREDREPKPYRVGEEIGGRFLLFDAGGPIAEQAGAAIHHGAPIRETSVITARETISSACQNRLKHAKRRSTAARKPLATTCPTRQTSHARPAP